MDTMKVTKIVGGVCGSLLVFMLIKWGAETIYTGGGAHGEGAAQAYTVAVPDAPGAGDPAEVVEVVPFADYYAVADAAAGERVFGKCRACHQLEAGEHRTGPSLFAVVNRDIGSEAGFGGYSDAMLAMDGEWTPEHMNEFLIKPAEYVVGTGMNFNGLGKPEDRANLIAYLATIN